MTHGCALKAPLPLGPYFHSVPSSPSVVAAGVVLSLLPWESGPFPP